jgi:hypothetical protein
LSNIRRNGDIKHDVHSPGMNFGDRLAEIIDRSKVGVDQCVIQGLNINAINKQDHTEYPSDPHGSLMKIVPAQYITFH